MLTQLNSGQLATIEEVLSQYAERLLALPNEQHLVGLYNGICGHLLFLYQLSLVRPQLVDEQIFNDKLEHVQEGIAYLSQMHDLCNGLTGVGWTLEYFNQQQEDDYDVQMCETIDQWLMELVSKEPWDGEIEFIYGLAGVLAYANRRASMGAAADLHEKLVDYYLCQVKNLDGGVSWSQPSNSNFRYDKQADTEYNLGLAHGVPGIISVLLTGFEISQNNSGKHQQQLESILIQSCDWLLSHGRKSGDDISYFSSCVGDNRNTRLGWCYGDLTIALTLVRVGKAINRSDYIEMARKVALDCAKRNAKQAMISDAGLCHGSAGVALIFKLLYRQLGDDELLQAGLSWLDYSLNLYREHGLDGLNCYEPMSKQYKRNSSFLMGDAGVGMCLLAYISDDFEWLDCMAMG